MHLCGPKEYTLEELVSYTAKTAGLYRIIIRLPDFIARLQARLLEWFAADLSWADDATH